MTEDIPLFEGNAVTIWAEYYEEREKEVIITVRIGMTTIQMPKSVFLQLQAGCNQSLERIKSKEDFK